MAFEGLSERLQKVFQKLKQRGKLSEEDVNEALREVRLALLEADVNFKVVKQFIQSIREQAIGTDVTESFTPGMVVINLVNKEMAKLMGGFQSKLTKAAQPPTVMMLVGLQGAGKTTTAGKLTRLLQKEQHRPLLVAADIYRPAAIKQLQVLGEQLQTPVFTMGTDTNPVAIAKAGIMQAKQDNHDIVIIDTAGRLQVDSELMDELKDIKSMVQPHEILLIVDAMTGQEAVHVAEQFHQDLELTGVILSKLDGDSRGGAALSIKAVTGVPIKYAAIGEKLDAIEPFHPERMASRILGMGDMLTLIEKAQTGIDQKKASEMERKMRNAEFTFDDFLEQMEQLRSMGPLDQVMDMIPGMSKMKKGMPDLATGEKQMLRVEAIVHSMTATEKQKPEIINASRRKRIAKGSGTAIQDVNRLLKQFQDMRKMMKQMSGMMDGKGKMKGKNNFKLPF